MTPRETDLLLDRTLHALGNVQPSPEFADRLRFRLAQAEAPPSSRARRLFFAPGSVALALCLTVIVAALGIRQVRSPHGKPLPQSSTRGQLGAGFATSPKLSSVAGSTMRTVPDLGPAHLEISNDLSHRTPNPPPGANRHVNSVTIVATTDPPIVSDDTQAVLDLRTPSFPAPPQPPTSQERLVRLMLRRGERHDLAQLDPEQTSRLANTEQRSFQKFFDPDPSPELALELKKGNPQ